ncbi:MAG TPA: hypothetical protein V6D09_26250 [Leptolyngbyaceae cyanobacterium]
MSTILDDVRSRRGCDRTFVILGIGFATATGANADLSSVKAHVDRTCVR